MGAWLEAERHRRNEELLMRATAGHEGKGGADRVDLSGDLSGIRYTKSGHLAIMVLSRPERGNALTRAMRPIVRAIWEDVRDDPNVRALVITGAGQRHFCTGLDLSDPDSVGGSSDGTGSVAEEIVWSPLHFGVWKPIVCALNGLVAGGGLHFVADADIVVAGEHVEIMDTHTSVGMVGAVENVALTNRLPIGSVLRLTLMGKHYRMPAARAYQLGLVDELVAPGDELAAAIEIAKLIAENSPTATRLSKQAVWSAKVGTTAAAQETAWQMAVAHRAHPDFAEGPKAFNERRPPHWLP
jgi:enoyl-CoA hydratase/carnithine racemase